MPPGLDPVLGFITRTAEDIDQQMADDEVSEISPSLDTSASSPMGQINSAVAKIASELWDALQAVYVAQDPDRNTGDGQDAVAAITGTTRLEATHSQVLVEMFMDAGTTVPAGSLMAVLGNPTALFELVGPEPAPGTPVVPGDMVAVISGIYNARFQAVETGAVAANAGTLTVIVTPVTGWNASTNNPDDADVGHGIETDSALRLRREQEIFTPGSTPVDALRAELYRLLAAHEVVGFVDVIENVQDVTDADGRPPHSIEVLIDDAPSAIDNDIIAQTIWDGRAGGIETFGSTTGTATDDLGVDRDQDFNRPDPIPIAFEVDIVIDTAIFPDDGDEQIKLAMVAHGQTLYPGDDVARNSFFGPIFSIPGVQNVPTLEQSDGGPFSTADIVIGVRERATFDTSDITITHV